MLDIDNFKGRKTSWCEKQPTKSDTHTTTEKDKDKEPKQQQVKEKINAAVS